MANENLLNNNTRYLGDSVYIKKEGHVLKLFLDNGEGPHAIIYLEPEVQIALVRYIENMVK
jgi:hypothetical protein